MLRRQNWKTFFKLKILKTKISEKLNFKTEWNLFQTLLQTSVDGNIKFKFFRPPTHYCLGSLAIILIYEMNKISFQNFIYRWPYLNFLKKSLLTPLTRICSIVGLIGLSV